MNETPRVLRDELELEVSDDYYLHWKGQLFTGLAVDHFPNGQTWSEEHFVNGLSHGLYREWFSSGVLRVESDMYGGVINGFDREWDEAGRLRVERVDELGYIVFEREWNEKGELVKDWIIGPVDWTYNRLQFKRQHFGFFAFKEL